MSVLYRPITHKVKKGYDVEPYDFSKAEEVAKVFKDKLSINTVHGALGFFLNLGQEYMQISVAYLGKQAKKMKKKSDTEPMKTPLVQNGDGINSFTS